MKCEPCGTLNLNTKNVEWLGLQNASKLQLQFIFSFIISKPMSPVETTLICLNIPLYKKVESLNTSIQNYHYVQN
jgi:hypothetical protein